MKILIKGAGDLATGIASRLYHCGHQVLMTEIAVPLTVRRLVALSRAVYEGQAIVEDMRGIRVFSMQEAEAVMRAGDIPVLVDPDAEIAGEFQPDVIVDAILAKKNLGTKITDAPFVVAAGPGFTAGVDCHCVVETKRGHTLGSLIYEGSAIPNTGVPGNVGGYTIERLIRAEGDGEMQPVAKIGDVVEKGQIVAYTGGKEVKAQMGGIVRGILQPGVNVWKTLKIGDIDARCEKEHCYTISDKAKSIGGGVLEAVTRFEFMRGKYALIVLAAGKSVRFGDNKLLAIIRQKPLYQHTLERMSVFGGYPQILVTGYKEIADEAGKHGIQVVMNHSPEYGISHSIKLGLNACLEQNPDIQGVLFSVCDQPNLEAATIQKLLNEAAMHKGRIICAGNEERPGNPVLWDRSFFGELMELSGDHGGKQVMFHQKNFVRYVEARSEELKDIDLKTDLIE